MITLYLHLGDNNYSVDTQYVPRIGEIVHLNTEWHSKKRNHRGDDTQVCKVTDVIYPIVVESNHYQGMAHVYLQQIEGKE